jgi:hypothetical protein
MKPTIKDRELEKFREAPGGKTSVAVTFDEAVDVNIDGVEWDEIVTTFPSTNQELFTYKLLSVIVQTVLITYETDQKKTIIKIEKTRF